MSKNYLHIPRLGIILLLYCLTYYNLEAQTIGRQVIASEGNSSGNQYKVSYTVGEIMVNTTQGNRNLITQGFQQPECSALFSSISGPNDSLNACLSGDSYIITLNNSMNNTRIGENYSYVLTDTSNNIINLLSSDKVNFGQLQEGNYRIYGVSYTEPYFPQPGLKIEDALKNVCRRISNNFLDISLKSPPEEAIINSPEDGLSLCGNNEISLSANPITSGEGIWKSSTGVQFDDQRNAETIVRNLQEGINRLSWEVRSGSCPIKSDTIEITFTPAPFAEILEGERLETCNESNISLSARNPNTPSNGTWSSMQELNFTSETSFLTSIDDFPQDSIFVYWTLETNGCSSQDSILIVNNEVSGIPEITQPNITDEDIIICSSTIKLEALPGINGEMGIWNIPLGLGINIDSPITSTKIELSNIPERQWIPIQWSLKKGTCSSSNPATFRLFNKGGASPAIIIPGNDTSICSGTPLEILANKPLPGEIGTWMIPGIGELSPEDTPEKVLIPNLTEGTYTLKWIISSEECPDSEDEISITVSDPPNVDLLGDDRTICKNSQATRISSNILDGLDYVWSDNTTGTSTLVNPSPGSSIPVWLSMTDKSGCILEDEIIVTRDNLLVSIEGEDICIINDSTEEAVLSANIQGNYQELNYNWSNRESTPEISVSVAGSYQVFVSNEFDCVESDIYTVSEDRFNTTISPGDTSIIPGTLIQLSASGGNRYEWEPDSTVSNPNIPNPTTQPSINSSYKVTIIRNSGCTYERSFFISILENENIPCGDIFIPDVFTPGSSGGDGKNDTWMIPGLPNGSRIKIFDRWGGLVYLENNFANKSWDGRLGNALLPNATYYFILEIPDEPVCRGPISLIQE